MPLESLPTELHTIIFELVCSVDMDSDAHTYRTARSLCLVSRYFYSNVVPIMYRTLLADGRTKASLLSRTLRCRPEFGDCAVHLFLSDRGRQARSPADDDALEVLPSFAFEYPGSREGRIERLQRMQIWLNARAQTLAAFRSAVQHILDVVSPHLQALSICLYGHYDGNANSGLADALAHPFPALVELTVRDNTHPQPCARLELPALERLHLAGGTPPHPFMALGALAEGCPRLTHIRLSEPFVNDAAVSALEGLLAPAPAPSPAPVAHPRPSSEGRRTRRRRRVSDTLERLILEPSPYMLVSPAAAGGGSESHGAGTAPRDDVFSRLAALAERSRVFDIVGVPSLLGGGGGGAKREDRYPFDDALRDWTDCVMGRAGCWRSYYGFGQSP